MNFPAQTNQPGQPKYVRFEVQHCLRVMYGIDSQYLPVDQRQVAAVLEPVSSVQSLDDHPNLSLIISQQPNGVEHALIDHCDGDVYLAADAGQDPNSVVSMARFAGEAWRVVGYEEGFPDEPYQMMVSDSLLAAQTMCNGLQALLKPVRVVLGMNGGAQQFICSDRAAELLVMDSAYAELNKENGSLVISSPYVGHMDEYAGEHYRSTPLTEMVQHFWDQIPGPEAGSQEASQRV
ncbi:hypothetical protein H8F21_13985 [Pseudomonas sp. P66]|uniref:Uncharacterized protein n=1 Tax=Pseudomonas arcuscaelestis TaxID=2710591 RepID=A0ABS2C0W7_9PSED|nr:hypothetical protein [Pseudomonas arcuscaelestis]MBM5458674.1 hypothetical protein [Pseudomonas arcuscaelestis]